jgi:hypothetical protein
VSLETLLVIVPARGRRGNCERMLGSFRETSSPGTGILFLTDPDDQDTYAGVDWGDAMHAVMEPRGSYIEKLNHGWRVFAGDYDAFMCLGDSNVFITPGWDTILLKALEDMGGHGWVYPENGRRRDIPEHWLASASVTGALGWFAPPYTGMYYGDNIIGELGKRSGLIRYVPEAVIEHRHYAVCEETVRDATYREAEDTWGAPDLAAFREWLGNQAKNEVSVLRRAFSPDVRWVLSRVA